MGVPCPSVRDRSGTLILPKVVHCHPAANNSEPGTTDCRNRIDGVLYLSILPLLCRRRPSYGRNLNVPLFARLLAMRNGFVMLDGRGGQYQLSGALQAVYKPSEHGC